MKSRRRDELSTEDLMTPKIFIIFSNLSPNMIYFNTFLIILTYNSVVL